MTNCPHLRQVTPEDQYGTFRCLDCGDSGPVPLAERFRVMIRSREGWRLIHWPLSYEPKYVWSTYRSGLTLLEAAQEVEALGRGIMTSTIPESAYREFTLTHTMA